MQGAPPSRIRARAVLAPRALPVTLALLGAILVAVPVGAQAAGRASGADLEPFLTPDGRCDLDAVRSRGYEGALDCTGFVPLFDPESGPCFARQDELGAWSEAFARPGVTHSGSSGHQVEALLAYENDLIVAGKFDWAGGPEGLGVPANYVARWNGIGWRTLGVGLNERVYDAVVFNGDLIVAGAFTAAGGHTANHIARWDGSDWHPLGQGTDGTVIALAVFGDQLIAGGIFEAADGLTVNYIAAWDGASWSDLNGGMDMSVWALCVWNGNLIAGGDFFDAGGVPAAQIARWDGGQWHALGDGFVPDTGTVHALTTWGGDLVVGGSFEQVAYQTANRLARWDGSNWHSVGTGAENGVDDRVWSLATIDDDLYVAGEFDYAGSVDCQNIARWDGAAWHALDFGLQGYVYELSVIGEQLHFGGSFNASNPDDQGLQVWMGGVGRWDGEIWDGFGRGLGNDVTSFAIYAGDLIVGGQFHWAGSLECVGVARWDGLRWHTMSNEITGVYALEVFLGDLIAGGSFNDGGPGPDYIARWDGNSWVKLHADEQPDDWVYSLRTYGDSLLVGGRFETAGSATSACIAAWDGSAWHSMGSGFGGYFESQVTDFAVYGGQLIVGGYFNDPLDQIAAWDGSQWNDVGGGMNGRVRALAPYGAVLVAGGDFTAAGGAPIDYIAQWDGESWSDMGGGMDGPVHDLALYNSTLIAGGEFTLAGSAVEVGNIARWDGLGDWLALGGGLDDRVQCLGNYGDQLFVGGTFYRAEQVPSGYIGAWRDFAMEFPDTLDYRDIPHISDGEALLELIDSLLVIGPIDSLWDDGVIVDPGPILFWHVDWDLGDALVENAGAIITATGRVDDAGGQPLGGAELRVRQVEDPQVDLVCTHPDAGTYRYQFFLDEQFVGSVDGGTDTLRVREWYRGSDDVMIDAVELWVDDGTQAMVQAFQWDTWIDIELGLIPYGPATQVTITPLDPGTATQNISRLEVHAARLSEIIFRNEYIENDPSGVDDERAGLLLRPRLYPSYPNPMQRGTSIVYSLPRRTPVRLEIYDIQGRLVRRLLDDVQPPGRYEIAWDGRDEGLVLVPSGIYYARLGAGSEVGRRKLVRAR